MAKHRVRVVLDNDTIKALPTTGFVPFVVGAPNKIVVPGKYSAFFDWTADYTNIDEGGSRRLQWEDISLPDNPANMDLVLDPGQDYISVNSDGFSIQSSSSDDILTLIGKSLGLLITNGGANFTGGHVANRVVVEVLYHLINLS